LFELFIHFDLGQAQITIPVLVQNFHERHAGFCVLTVDSVCQVIVREPVLSGVDAGLNCLFDFKQMDA